MNKFSLGFKYLMDGSLPKRSISFLRSYMKKQERKGQLKKQLKREKIWNSLKGNPELIVEVQPGVKMTLFTDDELSKLIFCSDYEKKELKFLNLILRPGDIFVDIGANIGLYTVIAAKIVGDNGQVYAFEPCGETYRRLVTNINLNNYKNVKCLKLALSDTSTELKIRISQDGFSGWNSIVQPTITGTFNDEVIQTACFDKIIEQERLSGRISMMKIDVEGWENHVLIGSCNLLSQPNAPILQVEFGESAMESAGSSCFELYKRLEGFGYKIYEFDCKKGELRYAPFHSESRYYWENLIAMKPPNHISERLKVY